MTPSRDNAMEQSVRHIATAISVASLYGSDHQQVGRLCGLAHAYLADAMNGRASVCLMRVDDRLAFDNVPLARSHYAERLARHFKFQGIGFVDFLKSITAEDVHRLVTALAKREKVIHSSAALRLGQIEVRHRQEGPAAAELELQDAVSQGLVGNFGGEELARVMEIYEAVRRKRQLHVVGLSEIVTEFIAIFSRFADPLLTLVPLRAMDEYTFTHSLNVCLLNLAQATALGYEGQLLHDIGLSALLHDIGKLYIPLEVLNKPGKLDTHEWELMRQHPVKGAQYLLDSPGVPRLAVVNAYEHHVRYDLKGYPDVGADWQQNLCSQMTTISDIFDSLRTTRPYREPLSLDEVIASLEEQSGTQLHPLLTRNFIGILRSSTVADAPEKPSRSTL